MQRCCSTGPQYTAWHLRWDTYHACTWGVIGGLPEWKLLRKQHDRDGSACFAFHLRLWKPGNVLLLQVLVLHHDTWKWYPSTGTAHITSSTAGFMVPCSSPSRYTATRLRVSPLLHKDCVIPCYPSRNDVIPPGADVLGRSSMHSLCRPSLVQL